MADNQQDEMCDRCGDELAKSFFGGLEGITLSQSHSFNEWNLCNDCKDDFLSWLHGESVRELDTESDS